MHTVVETSQFTRRADALLTRSERDELIGLLASDPQGGVVVPGLGGIRKMRFAAGGQGKRGGFRVVWFYHGVDVPVLALLIYGKNEQANPSPEQRRVMLALADELRRSGSRKGSTVGKKVNVIDELIESMKEGAAILSGEMEPSRVHSAPEPTDVRALRQRFGLSQAAFAARFGFSAASVRDWEQGRTRPDRATRSFLRVIEHEPEAVERALRRVV